MQCPNADEIIYTLHEREYVEKIEKAYSYASKTLLDLLMDDRALMARLRWEWRTRVKLPVSFFYFVSFESLVI